MLTIALSFSPEEAARHCPAIRLCVRNPSATRPTPTPGTSYDKRTYPACAAGNPVGQNGSANVAIYVSSRYGKGSITYVETAYAKEHQIPVASLLNASGDAVQPTSTDVTNALK